MSEYPLFPGQNDPDGSSMVDRFSSAFPTPFYSYATRHMPSKLEDVFRLAEHMWLSDGAYHMAMQRVVRYFLTRVELEDVDTDEKDKWEDFLEDTLKITSISATLGDDFIAYGNSFCSVFAPFRRFLICPKCGLHRPIINCEYKWEGQDFIGECPMCKFTGKFRRLDRRTAEQDKIRIIRWNPHQIKILYNPISQEYVYEWAIDADIKRAIQQGVRHILETTPWEIIEACKKEMPMFRFAPGVIYHMREDTLAGVRSYGWGIPRMMSNFKQGWLLQVLRRYNEAIGLDYIVPLRLLTPKGQGNSTDPLIHQDLGDFVRAMASMVKDHRKDPTSWHAVPFPVEYTPLSGEGQQLAPKDLIMQEEDSYLNGLGVVSDFYRGTLQTQAAPTALRLFERTWVYYATSQNNMLKWILNSCADLLNWERVSGRWQPVTLAEDIEKKQVQLQLASAMQISRQTAYAPFGIDYREEVHRMFEEEKYFQQEQRRNQEEQQQRQETEQALQSAMPVSPQQPQGTMAAGPGMEAPQGAGAGPAMGGAQTGGPVTPESLSAQAEQTAYQMLAMPYETRRGELSKIKSSNRELHALVTSKMDEIRQEAGSQGKQQILSQMQNPAQ